MTYTKRTTERKDIKIRDGWEKTERDMKKSLKACKNVRIFLEL